MKKMALVLFIVGVGLINAQVEVPNAPQWKITLHVINEDGTPVTNATAFVDYYVPAPPPERQGGYKWTGLTDCSGCFTVAIHAGQHIGYGAEKPGYYSTDGLEYRFQSEVDRKWQPWNPTNDIVLKRIIKPIPMYAKRIDAQPPADGNPVGYDLMAGDWVAPYGKGINPDILFTREYNRKSLQDYDYKLTVSFPKAGDGIQEFQVPYKNMEGSALRSPHEAPTNGYQPQIVRLNVSHPGQKLIFDYDENRVYFFRVRTVLDENGNVKSALYGKIYGDFMQFSYYLNPTPNSRNVEFDPKQNLMKNLKPLEGVEAP
jgi:hypothetical protein